MSDPDPRADGVRQKYRRNRQIKYPPNLVLTDGVGNVTSRPLTPSLDCFGDPIEWLWGRTDRPTQFANQTPQPFGCALCPLTANCSRVAWERINSSPSIASLREVWDKEAAHLPLDRRFCTKAWADLVHACNAAQWSDTNDKELEAAKLAKCTNRRKTRATTARAGRAKKHRRIRPVPMAVAQQLARYREDRVLEITLAFLAPNAPLWIRNRTSERCHLIAYAWEARELLIAGNRKASGSAVLEQLRKFGRVSGEEPARMVKVVADALNRADKLVASGDWPDPATYIATAAVLPGHGQHYSVAPTSIAKSQVIPTAPARAKAPVQ